MVGFARFLLHLFYLWHSISIYSNCFRQITGMCLKFCDLSHWESLWARGLVGCPNLSATKSLQWIVKGLSFRFKNWVANPNFSWIAFVIGNLFRNQLHSCFPSNWPNSFQIISDVVYFFPIVTSTFSTISSIIL